MQNITARVLLIPFIYYLFGCQQQIIRVENVNGCPVTLNHEVRLLNESKTVNLCKTYLGNVILIVNTASKCAFTNQYEDLEKLYAKYKDRGFVILGFPSNNFANQEPGTEKEVQSFCRLTYGVKFPMFSKTNVKKENADPVYKVLGDLTKRYPKWNFYKYLLDRQGNIVDSYSSITNPMSGGITSQIEKLLESKPPEKPTSK